MSRDFSEVILVGHPVCDVISVEEMTGALSSSLERTVVSGSIMLSSSRMPIAELANANWQEAQRRELDQFTTSLKPLLSTYSDANICYFGLAPIPVAMYLGYLIGTMRTVAVFQKHHETQQWNGSVPPPVPRENYAQVIDHFQDIVAASGEAIIRVSVSYEVERQATLNVVPDPLAEVDVRVPVLGPDSTHESDALESVAAAFRTALDRIKQYRPNTTMIHVFAAAPVGVAFKLGARVSPTIHPEIMTYQYVNRGAERYRPAFILHHSPQSTIELTPEDRVEADVTRHLWGEEIKKLAMLVEELDYSPTNLPAWLSSLFPQIGERVPVAFASSRLASLRDTELPQSSVSGEPATIDEGFLYSDRHQCWHFSDELLHTFNKQFKDEADLKRAGRLLLLHEAVHLSDHALTETTAPRIGRFPKILEDADYSADLWGFLHEYAFSRSILKEGGTDRQLFTKIIETAIQSFWAFDDTGRDQTEIQVRRIHRYLNWYWQALHMERIRSADDALRILLLKPHIEIAGPDIRAAGDRVFYPLNGKYGRAELAVMHENKILRFANTDASRISDIFEGFRRRSSEQIRSALKGVFDQVVDRQRK